MGCKSRGNWAVGIDLKALGKKKKPKKKQKEEVYAIHTVEYKPKFGRKKGGKP